MRAAVLQAITAAATAYQRKLLTNTHLRACCVPTRRARVVWRAGAGLNPKP